MDCKIIENAEGDDCIVIELERGAALIPLKDFALLYLSKQMDDLRIKYQGVYKLIK